MAKEDPENTLPDNLTLELRRGVIILAVLSQLHQDQYGYSLMSILTGKGLEIDQGTLYPLLRRLESRGLLVSDWRVEESRPRRYYRISPKGAEILPLLTAEWKRLSEVMKGLLQ